MEVLFFLHECRIGSLVEIAGVIFDYLNLGFMWAYNCLWFSIKDIILLDFLKFILRSRYRFCKYKDNFYVQRVWVRP